MKMCSSCFLSYKKEIEKIEPIEDMDGNKYIQCLSRDCNGKVIDIDDLMAPIIDSLNLKGYTTTACCSGHIEDGENAYTYIDFAEGIKFEMYPEFFNVFVTRDIGSETEGFYTVGIGYQNTENIIDIYEAIMEYNIMLYEWALSLKDLNDDGPIVPNNNIIPFKQ